MAAQIVTEMAHSGITAEQSREYLKHVGIASLERKFREWRGGCCKWEVQVAGTAPRVALGVVVVKSASRI